MTTHPPDGLIPSRSSSTFTQDTLPATLQAEHTLAPGHWAVLNVIEGSLRFVNLDTGEECLISAPDLVTIHPGLPHRVALEGRVRCRIDFYREPSADGADNQAPTIGEVMDSAAEIGKRGVRTVQAGVGAVTKAAGRIPRVVRRVAGKDEADSETLPEKVIVEGLPDEAMESYLSVLVWLVHTGDKQIDEREMCEIQLLMTQRRCSADVRQAVRGHLENPHILDAREQIDQMLERGPAAGNDTRLALKCALMKDAIRVCRATSEGPARKQPAIRQLAEMLDLDDEKVRVIEDVCEQDEKILSGELSDSQIAATAKELAARATSVGVPVAAGPTSATSSDTSQIKRSRSPGIPSPNSFPRIAPPRSNADSTQTSAGHRGTAGTTAPSHSPSWQARSPTTYSSPHPAGVSRANPSAGAR